MIIRAKVMGLAEVVDSKTDSVGYEVEMVVGPLDVPDAERDPYNEGGLACLGGKIRLLFGTEDAARFFSARKFYDIEFERARVPQQGRLEIIEHRVPVYVPVPVDRGTGEVIPCAGCDAAMKFPCPHAANQAACGNYKPKLEEATAAGEGGQILNGDTQLVIKSVLPCAGCESFPYGESCPHADDQPACEKYLAGQVPCAGCDRPDGAACPHRDDLTACENYRPNLPTEVSVTSETEQPAAGEVTQEGLQQVLDAKDRAEDNATERELAGGDQVAAGGEDQKVVSLEEHKGKKAKEED